MIRLALLLAFWAGALWAEDARYRVTVDLDWAAGPDSPADRHWSRLIAFAHTGPQHFDGYVALGCVIRGETTHYEIVCEESARALMDLSIAENLAIGNGILTVENEDQAWDRADQNRKDKGGGAAEAALAMVALRAKLGADV